MAGCGFIERVTEDEQLLGERLRHSGRLFDPGGSGAGCRRADRRYRPDRCVSSEIRAGARRSWSSGPRGSRPGF